MAGFAFRDAGVAGSAFKDAGVAGPWRHDGLHAVGSIQHFVQGWELYCEGGDADVFFKVVSGMIRTCRFLSDGRRQIDAFHISGDMFGFEAGTEQSLSAEAVSNCTVITYHRHEVETLTAHNEGLSYQLYTHALRSLARAQTHSLLLGRRSAAEKVAAFLLDQAGQSLDCNVVNLAMTRQDIADYLGLTIESVSRTLSRFEREALIELTTPRQVRIRDAGMLRNLRS